MSLTGATGPAPTRIETGLLAAMNAFHANHAPVAVRQDIASVASGERVEPSTIPTPSHPIDPGVPIPAALISAGARIQRSPLVMVGRNAPPIAEPQSDEDLKARVERILGLTGGDNGSAASTAPMTCNKSAASAPRQPLCGGTYPAPQALHLLNSHYLVGKSEQEVAIFRIGGDGLLTYTPNEQFKLDVANIFVEIPDSVRTPGVPTSKGVKKDTKLAAADQYWMKSDLRNEKRIIFSPDPNYIPKPDEFNLWRGFGVEPRKGWQKQRRLLRHIRDVICRHDKKKFKYLICWLAWAVQHPDKAAGVVIVLVSRRQGTGKSTLGTVMQKIFGNHGALIDDSERLLGRFNAWQEPISFILAEEILWAGDHKTADKLKSRLTADTIQIEHKNGPVRQIPNRLHLLMTTNHEHAIAAGVGDRRNVVYDVSDEHACDQAWFDPLYRDLEAGGYREFLWFLQHVNLGYWHPRQIIKTVEATEQQRMSGDSISQWSHACMSADAVIGDGLHQYELGNRIAAGDLRTAYTSYCKQLSLRPANDIVFGNACAEMFGPRKRMSALPMSGTQSVEDTGPTDPSDDALDQRIAASSAASPSTEAAPGSPTSKKKRLWGYDVPDGDEWQEKIDARLGIKK